MPNPVSLATDVIRIYDDFLALLESIAPVLDTRQEEEFRWLTEKLLAVYDDVVDGWNEQQKEIIGVDPQVAEYVERATAMQAEVTAANREAVANSKGKRVPIETDGVIMNRINSVELHEEEVPDTIEVSDEEPVDDDYFSTLLSKE